MTMGDKLSWAEWVEVYKKLVYWELGAGYEQRRKHDGDPEDAESRGEQALR